MMHTPKPMIGLAVASLVFACGCASSPTRARVDNAQGADQWTAANETSSQPSIEISDDLVIGQPIVEQAVPEYHGAIKSFTMDEIRDELEAMYDQDEELVRETLGSEAHDRSTVTRILAIDQARSDRLKEIVDTIGWPTREMVGLKATEAAYMVIQHAGHDIEFQNRCLAMMVDLVKQDQLPASYVALLSDRIRLFQNQPQLFGTQIAMALNEHGVMVPTPTIPIEDPEHLDDRRALMGMPPYHEFVGAIALAYEASKVDAGKAFAEVPTDE